MNLTIAITPSNNLPLRWFTVVNEGEGITGDGGEGGNKKGSLIGLVLIGVSRAFLFLELDIPLGPSTPLRIQISCTQTSVNINTLDVWLLN